MSGTRIARECVRSSWRRAASLAARLERPLAFGTMPFGRRLVTILASTALLQLMLLGSGVPCVTPMVAAGPHAEHGEEHAAPAHAAAGDEAHDADHGDSSRQCELRACTVPPLSADGDVALAAAPLLPDGQYPPLDDSPSSHARSLDPPPPRA